MFFNHQICILEWFLKIHYVKLKTGVMMLKMQLCHNRNRNIIGTVVLYCNNISEYYIFDQINAVSMLLSYSIKKSYWPQTFEWYAYIKCTKCLDLLVNSLFTDYYWKQNKDTVKRFFMFKILLDINTHLLHMQCLLFIHQAPDLVLISSFH